MVPDNNLISSKELYEDSTPHASDGNMIKLQRFFWVRRHPGARPIWPFTRSKAADPAGAQTRPLKHAWLSWRRNRVRH